MIAKAKQKMNDVYDLKNEGVKIAKRKIRDILKEYDVQLKPIDMNTVGIVSSDYVVNQEIEKWERI